MHESATVMRYAERPFSKNKNTQQEQVHANENLGDMALSDGDVNNACCSYQLRKHTKKLIQIVSIAEARTRPAFPCIGSSVQRQVVMADQMADQ